MAPKAKGGAPAGSLPVPEDEVSWPADVETVPDPPFFYAIAHMYSHIFQLEDQAPEGDAIAPLREFDPCTLLAAALKEESPEDPLARQVVPTDREELQGLAEGGSLARGLRNKAEKESAARKRRKTNQLRSKVIASHEAAVAEAAVQKERREAAAAAAAERAAKMAEHEAAVAAANEAGTPPPDPPVFDEPLAAGEAAPAEAPEGDAEAEAPEEAETEKPKPPPNMDFVLAVFGYPETAAELQELQDEGIFGVSDVWISAYLSGESTREEAPVEDAEADPAAEPVPPRRIREVCSPPEILAVLKGKIDAAEMGSPLAYGTICTIPRCHELAPPAEFPEGADTSGAALAAEVRSSVLEVISQKSERRKAFDEWMGSVVERKLVPVLKKTDSRLYVDLVNSIDPARHDIPLLLHCMCEQVNHSLAGDRHDGHGPCNAPLPPGAEGGDDEELNLLDIYLHDVHTQAINGILKKNEFAADEEAAAPVDVAEFQVPNWNFPGCQLDAEGDSLILPFLDRAGCRHVGDEISGHVPVDEAVHRIWSHAHAPGVRRSGFPKEANESASRRCAQRNRIYSMMPSTPIVVFEKLLVLDEFERLLNSAQPERSWQLQDRVFHERVPRELVQQVLLDAFRSECFVDTAYVSRHDCLLIALYHRSLPGRTFWHGWAGDHLASSEADVLRTVPTFNDWCTLIAPNNQNNDVEASTIKRPNLLNVDGRESGYCKVMEKVLTPSDGSVIIRTCLQRGLAGTFEGPPEGRELPSCNDATILQDASTGEDTESDFVAPCRYELQSTKVVKADFTFGMVTDDAWAQRRPHFHNLRQKQEQAEAEAAEAARVEAARLAEEQEGEGADLTQVMTENAIDTTTVRVDQEGDEITTVRLENLNFGIFWLVFQDSSRCSCRIHHERPFWPEGAFTYDTSEGRPGMVFTYSPVVGLTVQVFSDGAVRQTWPPELRGPQLAGNLSVQSSSGSSWSSGALPGGPEDCELARTVTPFGSVVRELLSGRREVYHPDGTCAARNPTLEELQEHCERWRDLSKSDGALVAFEMMNAPQGMKELGGPLAYLEAITAATRQLHGPQTDAESGEPVPPSELAKAAGIPGHWRISRLDGTVYGRACVPPAPPPPVKEETEENAEGGDPPAASPPPDAVEGEAGEEGDAAAEPEEVEPPVPWDVMYANRLGGNLIDDGKTVEYQIQSISVAEHIDPHTAQLVTTHAEGLLTFEDDGGGRRVCIHADGTRQIWEERQNGYRVSVERQRVARIQIDTTVSESEPCVNMIVDCADGTQLQVVPRCTNLKGELAPSDPSSIDPLDASRNASVLLRRKDGTIVNSRGTGEINIASSFDVAVRGESEILSAVETPGLYTAFCTRDMMCFSDAEGDFFEVRGDQTVDGKVADSSGDKCKSPRCKKSGTPAQHPQAASLPLPEDVPEPRLFVVYGDGEAEELLITRNAAESLRLAKLDPECVVVEGEHLGPPMDACLCHTIFRSATSDAVSVPPLPIEVPPSVAGFHPGTDAFAPAPGRSYTEFRQFIEYPVIDAEHLAEFREVLKQHHEKEERYQVQQAAYGQGLRKNIVAVSPEVGGGA